MNDYIKNAITNIQENKLEEMRTNFSNAITEKAIKKLEEKKIEVAKSFFETK